MQTVQTRSVASDLGLHCLPRSKKRDARIIWVNDEFQDKLDCHLIGEMLSIWLFDRFIHCLVFTNYGTIYGG